MKGVILMGVNRFQKLYDMGYDIEKKRQPVIVELEEAMRKNKISSMTLCKKTGISRQTMSAVLNGNMKPGVDFALKVSKVIGIPVEELFKLHDSAWETLVTEDSQSIYWDLLEEKAVERREMKVIESEMGVQYWSTQEGKIISEAEYKNILEEELEKRMDEEIEWARKQPVGRRDEKVFQRMARTKIEEDVEKRYPLRFHRVVKSIKPVT
ncbi:helix-turn-helix transcriptional regulator [Rossellomorea marisflavi]|uniref:helix-turn-helix transcriptional regulator n=1 Tax=Rossellomorea marisflavi TaxID=189381 RepID=UPI003F9F0EF6